MANTRIVYMIQRNSDGLFSTGGCDPRFTKKGKCWNSIGALKSHLHLFHDHLGIKHRHYPYADCTIVPMEIERKPADLKDWSVDAVFEQLIKDMK